MGDIKYRVVGTFQLLFVRAEEIENNKEKVRLLFASPVRIGSGTEIRNLSAKECLQFLGGIWRSKIFKKVGIDWKSQGLSLVPGNFYEVEAAIDNFSISNDKGRRSDGLWFEILGAPIPLKEAPIFRVSASDDLTEEVSDVA